MAELIPEQTLVLVKPDGVARGLVGEILGRALAKGYTLTALQLRTADRPVLEQHYAEHAAKPWFGELEAYLSSGPLVTALAQARKQVAISGPLGSTMATRSLRPRPAAWKAEVVAATSARRLR